LIALAALALDWRQANVSTMPAGPTSIFDFEPAAARAIHPDGRPLPGNFRIFREEMDFRDLNPDPSAFDRLQRRMIWERNSLKRNLDTMEGFEDVVGFNESRLVEGLDILKKNLSPDLMALYNVEYMVTRHGREPLASIRSETVLDDGVNDVKVLRFPDVWPRAFLVPDAAPASGEAEALDKLRSVDLRKTVVLTTDEKIEAAATGAGGMEPVLISHYSPDEVMIETDAEAAGWLVLSDRFYPGWKAFVDGRPEKIYRANVLVRAVRIPGGEHRVHFRFQPFSLRVGGAVSIIAWIAVFAFWVGPRLTGRRSPGAETHLL
jgi:hypothetical protein